MLFTREQTAIQKVVHGNRNKDEAKGGSITLKREIFSQTRQILLNMARESENNMPVAVTILVRRLMSLLVKVRAIVLSRTWHVLHR